MEKSEWFLQADIQNFIVGTLGKEPWVVVYQNKKTDDQDIFFYSALVPNGEVDKVLDKIEFDFSYPYFGLPVSGVLSGPSCFFAPGRDDRLIRWRPVQGQNLLMSVLPFP